MFSVKYFLRLYPDEQTIVQLSNILDGSVIQDYIWFLAGLFWCFCIFYLPGKYIFSHSIMLGILLVYCIVRLLKLADIHMLGFQYCDDYLLVFALGYTFNVLYEKMNETMERMITNTKVQLAYIFIYFYLIIKNYNLPVDLRLSGGVTSCAGIIMVLCVSLLLKKAINIEKCGEVLKKLSYYTFPVYLLHMPLWYLLEVYIAPMVHQGKFVVLYWLFEIGFVIIIPICLAAFYNKMKLNISKKK